MRQKKIQKTGKYASAGATAFTTLGITAHNFCHYLCLGVVALLSVAGITAAGMPLMWLEDYAVYFWLMGLIFLGVSFYLLYTRPFCISKNAITANTGLLIAAVPLKNSIGSSIYLFWAIGGLLFGYTALLYLKSIWKNNRRQTYGNAKTRT